MRARASGRALTKYELALVSQEQPQSEGYIYMGDIYDRPANMNTL